MTSVYFQRNYQRAFGTYPLTGNDCVSAVKAAIDVGYRAIDTAQMYNNEAAVGEAVATCGVPREDLLITTKVHPDNFGEDRFIPSVKKSLADLGLDVIDVLILHWPPLGGDVVPSLKLLSRARAEGLTKHVGISNYNVAMMRLARETIDDPIATNQVEFHPLLDQSVLLAGANEVGIPLSAYCSVARGEVFKHDLFEDLAQVYGKSAGQIVLRWILQTGVSVNTMSSKPQNMKANYEVMDFTLSSVDMARIDALTKTNHRIVTNDMVPWAPQWD